LVREDVGGSARVVANAAGMVEEGTGEAEMLTSDEEFV
jgi:hypothetical protein